MQSKLKIHTLQLVTPNIDDYAVYSIASIFHFCKKNQLTYSVQRESLIDDMHINWTKIQLLKNALSSCDEATDFVLLIDADTIIFKPDTDLSDFLGKFLNDNCHILMPQDNPTNPFKRNRPNAGFIVVRNSKKGKEIIDQWLVDARGACAHLNDQHPRNQRVFWNCVQPKFAQHLVIMPLSYFHKRSSKAFIHHFMKRKGDHRRKKMKKVYHTVHVNGIPTEVLSKLHQKTGQIDFLKAN